MNLRPLHNCVLIEQEIEKHDGLIVMPTTSEKRLFQGTVIAMGNGLRSQTNGEVQPMDVKVGDRVLFGEYSGQKTLIDGKEYLMMREPDIIGVFDGV